MALVDAFVVERTPRLLAAVAMLAFAVWIVYLRPRDPLHRAFARLLLFMAALEGLLTFTGEPMNLPHRMTVYFLVAVPFAALDFAWIMATRYATFRHRVRRWGRFLRPAIWVTAAGFMLWYLADHSAWLTDEGFRPLNFFDPIRHPLFALIALVAALEYLNTRPGTCRNSLLVLSLAFAMEAAFRPFWHMGDLLVDRGELGTDGVFIVHFAMRALSIFVLALLVSVLVYAGRREGGTTQGQVNRYLVALSLPVLTGIGLPVAYASGMTLSAAIWALFASDALWMVMMVALSAFAIVRYRLFDIELRARFVLAQGTWAASLGLTFLVLAELIENTLDFSSTAASVAAAAAIAALIKPVHIAAERLAARAMPGVAKGKEYEERRRQELYRAAVEGAMKDGVVTDRERDILHNLQEELGLARKQAKRVETDVAAA